MIGRLPRLHTRACVAPKLAQIGLEIDFLMHRLSPRVSITAKSSSHHYHRRNRGRRNTRCTQSWMYAEFSVDRARLFRASRGQSIIYPRLTICHIQNALNHCPGKEHWREYDGIGATTGAFGAIGSIFRTHDWELEKAHACPVETSPKTSGASCGRTRGVGAPNRRTSPGPPSCRCRSSPRPS